MSLKHAKQHSALSSELDTAQVILSLDYAMEMLLKAVLLNRGENIMKKPKESIGLLGALDACPDFINSPSVRILRDRRDSLQHAAAYIDIATARDLYEAALMFVEEVLETEFKLPVPRDLRLQGPAPEKKPPVTLSVVVAESNELQRDIHARNRIAVWSQGIVATSNLAVFVQEDFRKPRRLTSDGAFEYMPRTDGTSVVAYRQSGGVVHYDLASGVRTLLSENGGPTDVYGDWVAAQGLSIPDGLGGGISLFNKKTGLWTQIAASGDSARLDDKHLVWQDLIDGRMHVRIRNLDDGEARSLMEDAGHPSITDGVVSCTDWPRGSTVYVMDVSGRVIASFENGIFPSIGTSHVAFLRPTVNSHALKVFDYNTNEEVLSIDWAGFPMASGPVIDGRDIYFESKYDGNTMKIWRSAIPGL